MKLWSLFFGLFTGVLLFGMAFKMSRLSPASIAPSEIPGAKIDWSDDQAAKEIRSEDIVKFYCQFFWKDEDGQSISAYYTLERQGEAVVGHAEDSRLSAGRDFTADATALATLQKIIASSGIVSRSGENVHVNGLPDLGGTLAVDYASGERLYISNNQILRFEEAVPDLMKLFEELTQ